MRNNLSNHRRFLRRRRLLYLRRGLLLLACAAIVALLIATPIWIVNGVRNHRKDQDAKSSKPGTSANDSNNEDEQDRIPVVDEDTVMLGGTIQSEYAVLLDMTDKRVVAAKNPNEKANPASITKVMTLLVAVENIDDLDAEYIVPWQVTHQVAGDASRAGLAPGDVFPLRDLLYGCILPSGGDAAVALAHYVSGMDADHLDDAEAWFAQKMNERAAELGATDTNFVNVSGLHHADHKTSAMDMALIMAAAMKNPICREVLMADRYSSIATQSLPPNRLAGGEWCSTLFTQWLGSDRYGIVAGKTGFTNQALNTLVTYTVGADNHEYVLVTMRVNGSRKAVEDACTIFETYCR